MTFHLKVNMDNAAFEDQEELGRILQQVARSMSGGYGLSTIDTHVPVRDFNGNTVGSYHFSK